MSPDRVEVRSFGNWLRTRVRTLLIDGESCPAWKCAFLPFTDSRRRDTSEERRRRFIILLGTEIVRGEKENPAASVTRTPLITRVYQDYPNNSRRACGLNNAEVAIALSLACVAEIIPVIYYNYIAIMTVNNSDI